MIADAMRPRVIGRDRESPAQPLSSGKIQALIALCPTVVYLPDAGIALALRRVLQIQRAAEVHIAGRGARSRRCQAILARHAITWNIRGQVYVLSAYHMDGAVAEVIRAEQPILSHLLLHAEILLMHVYRVEILQGRVHISAKRRERKRMVIDADARE